MEYSKLIETRRSLRSLEKTEITEAMVRELYDAVKLTPSCFNHQPWRFVFTYENDALNRLFEALSRGNAWARHASMIVTVFSKKELDCSTDDGRDYYALDTGMALFNLLLKLTDLGYVAHPIAGFDPKRAAEILNVPDDFEISVMVIVGKHSETMNADLSEKQVAVEHTRPPRKEFDEICFLNTFHEGS